MATQQKEGGVPVSIAHRMQPFRLFELPPEIVELLDAPNPPLLSIKSQVPTNGPGAKPAYAVLCTPGKSYQLRQVQTSNSLYVTQPALEAQGDEIPIPVTHAIASCTATLELHPTDVSAASLLREVLPLYDIVAGEADATGNGKGKETVFLDLPLSDGQCQAGWDQVVAFEHDGSTFQPTANALSQVWKSIIAVALAEGIRLNSQFLTDDISRAVAEEGHPSGLAVAILRHLSTSDQDPNGPWSRLDSAKTIPFVGKTLLSAKIGDGYLIAAFLDTWQDSLPEAWRLNAKLEAIDGAYHFPTDSTIRAGAESVNTTKSDSVPSTAPKPSARKWHEKFGKTRKK